MECEHEKTTPEGAKKYARIVESYLNDLISKQDYTKAVRVCVETLGSDPELWEKWIITFTEHGQMTRLVDYIPTRNPTLKTVTYTNVIIYFLRCDPDRFLQLISAWESLFDVKEILIAMKTITPTEKHKLGLAQLYTNNNEPKKALEIYLDIRHRGVFNFIEKHHLYESVSNQIGKLLQVDAKETMNLLISNTDKIAVPQAVQQLSRFDQKLLHEYLHTLFQREPNSTKEYHKLQVELYAKYEYPALRPFLIHSVHYDLDEALGICKKLNLYPEQALLLSRMGNFEDALVILMYQVQNVKEALEFVQSQNDPELWNLFVKRAIDLTAKAASVHGVSGGEFLGALLDNMGPLDPVTLISQIPDHVYIENLQKRLVKILADHNLMSLRQGCTTILQADCVRLFDTLFTARKKGAKALQIKCCVCSGFLFGQRPFEDVCIFTCPHSYHTRCLRSQYEVLGISLPLQVSPAAAIAAANSSGSGSASAAAAAARSVLCIECNKSAKLHSSHSYTQQKDTERAAPPKKPVAATSTPQSSARH
ncbi:vacuolar protein sorting-associated protein [Pelomyxa schiedti]|nr:vacuolar protein sorting-associated protein [Pelomyxa schiedti]